jgi:hypothetical protein
MMVVDTLHRRDDTLDYHQDGEHIKGCQHEGNQDYAPFKFSAEPSGSVRIIVLLFVTFNENPRLQIRSRQRRRSVLRAQFWRARVCSRDTVPRSSKQHTP